METPENKASEVGNIHWLNTVEIVVAASSVAGSIACILLEKFVYAYIPLSASVVLNSIARQRTITAISEKKQSILISQWEKNESNNSDLAGIQTQIQTREQHNESRYLDLSKKITELQKLQHVANAELSEQVLAGESNLKDVFQEISDIRNSLSQLNMLNHDLDTSFNNLTQQQIEIDRAVKEMRVLGNSKQNIAIEDNDANSYYDRGLVYQNNGYHDKAIANYQKALELEPDFAEVYHQRGLLYQEINRKQKAVEDLRKASQLYFDRQDLDNYNLTRDLSQKVHQAENIGTDNSSGTAMSSKVAVNELFS